MGAPKPEDLKPLLQRIATALERLAPPAPAEVSLDAADAFLWRAECAGRAGRVVLPENRRRSYNAGPRRTCRRWLLAPRTGRARPTRLRE